MKQYNHSNLKRSKGLVMKQIEPTFPFTSGGQETLMADMLEFRHRLQIAGVPITDRYNLSIRDGVITEETADCGIDGFCALKKNKLAVEVVLGKIIKGLLPILKKESVDVVPDPHPANWCFLPNDDEVYYIDFQPARFRRDDGIYLVGFPQPIGQEYDWAVQRYYSKQGLVRMLRFNAIRAIGVAGRTRIEEIIRDVIPSDLFQQLGAESQPLLEQRVRLGDITLAYALDQCDEWRIDDIRELALVVGEKLGDDAEAFLGEVLNLTRGDFNLPVSMRKRKVAEAKLLVLQHI